MSLNYKSRWIILAISSSWKNVTQTLFMHFNREKGVKSLTLQRNILKIFHWEQWLARVVCLQVPEQTAPRQARFKDSHKNKREEFCKNQIKLDQNGPEEEGVWVHPYTFLQALACRHKQSAVGRVLAGLCLCPHLGQGEHVKAWPQATLRGTSTQLQNSPSHQKAIGAVISSVVSHRRALRACSERQAIQWPQHKPRLYNS